MLIGRFEAAKDYPSTLRAFKAVSAKRPDAVLLLVGQGSLLEEVKNLAVELGLEDKVRFLGVQRDIPELMNVADTYVMSSAREGLPIST
jgi:glycosyltransferase involved in cell wall biosynthesis